MSRVAGTENRALAEFASGYTISKLGYMIPSANNLSTYNLELNVNLTQLRYIFDAILRLLQSVCTVIILQIPPPNAFQTALSHIGKRKVGLHQFSRLFFFFFFFTRASENDRESKFEGLGNIVHFNRNSKKGWKGFDRKLERKTV
jgi:hypothetical protein